MTTGLEVGPWTPADAADWDAYVLAHPRATFFHQCGWKRALESFLPHACYLLARRGGAVCGVLPLFRCRRIDATWGLYSLPHTVYGGPLGDSAEVEQRLIDEATALAQRNGAAVIELRNRHPTLLDLPTLPGFVTFERALPTDPRALLRSFRKGARAAVHQAARTNGLTAELGGDLDTFYELFARSYRNLGTPVFAKRFLAAVASELAYGVQLLTVRHHGRPVAGVLAVRFRSVVMPLFTGEAPGARPLRANDLKFFRLMTWAAGEGLRFDFGRSRLSNPGVVAFKRHRGFEPLALPYQQIRLREGPPARAPDPNRGAYRLARALWRRLPRSLADRLGPRVVRFFP